MVGGAVEWTDFLYGTVTTVLATGWILLAFAVIWYVVPLRRLAGDRRR